MKNNFVVLGTVILATACLGFTQNPPAKTPAKKSSSAATVAQGKEVFDAKCAICHYADNDTKKVGPGLKGMSKRGTFSVNHNKITDESLKAWIENGDSLMPPFKDTLDATQIKDVIAYVKTL